MDRFDIAIIGTGPAGVSAAITARIRNKNIILFGSTDLSGKMYRAKRILNYPGLPGISGPELCGRMRAHLDSLDIVITEARVGTVYAMGSYYGIQAGETMYEAESCILATGTVSSSSIPGEDEFLGRGVSSCATCDGRFYRDKSVAVIGYNKESAEDAIYLADMAAELIYIPMQEALKYTDIVSGHDNISILREKPLGISGTLRVDTLTTDRSSYRLDGIFVIRDAAAPEKLVPGLRVSDGHVDVDRQMRTNLKGMFACGDVTGTPYQYIKAAGEGGIAALSAVRYLTDKKLHR